jgi:hypothetical protein
MNEMNKAYLKDCLDKNDLMIFGIYDYDQDYGIFHKWGTAEDVGKIVKVMKQTANRLALKKDSLVTFKYPEFSMDDFYAFIENATYFSDWVRKKIA